jgi:hypothetical protein
MTSGRRRTLNTGITTKDASYLTDVIALPLKLTS